LSRCRHAKHGLSGTPPKPLNPKPLNALTTQRINSCLVFEQSGGEVSYQITFT
jgi:hypothetical protein